MRPEIEKRITEKLNPTKVNLASLDIGDDELLEILVAIKKHKSGVTCIDLDNNQISDKGALLLKQALCDLDNMDELSLQYNDIGREGALAVFSLKKQFQHLDILFRGNHITNVNEMDDIEALACAAPRSYGR